MITRARKLWDRLAQAKIQLPLLPAYEQTRLSWAKLARSYDDVPDVFRDLLATVTHDAGGLPYTVLTPTFQGFLRRPNEKLICTYDDEIWVMEKVQNRAMSTCYRAGKIYSVETGSILLKGWITLKGPDSSGVVSSSTLQFNAVTESLFTPIVNTVRPRPDTSSGVDHSAEMDKFNCLAQTNFKFMNYARRTIIPGEKVIHFVLQPEVRADAPRLFGRSWWGTIHPAHLTVLTDKELILIRDEAGVRWNPDAKHGGIWTYIPLDKIAATSSAEADDGLITVSIHLPGNDRVDVLFSAWQEKEVSHLVSQVESLTR
jgi:hypothetical protein